MCQCGRLKVFSEMKKELFKMNKALLIFGIPMHSIHVVQVSCVMIRCCARCRRVDAIRTSSVGLPERRLVLHPDTRCRL